jgi:hypothetical protein
MQSMLRSSFFRVVSWYLVAAMLVIGVTPRVYAGLAPSEAVSLSYGDRAADLQKIQKILEMKMISQRLTEFGLTPEEIQTRMSRLNDQQIHQFALQLEQIKVAGDPLDLLIGLLVVAILVVILIYLLGHRVVVR